MVILSSFFISCDKAVGTDGVVVNNSTGERIPDVSVKMTSEQGDRKDITDSKGYFDTTKWFSCGIGNCNTDYKIEFTKDGFEKKVINENFYDSSEVEFTNNEKKDTLIIRLIAK